MWKKTRSGTIAALLTFIGVIVTVNNAMAQSFNVVPNSGQFDAPFDVSVVYNANATTAVLVQVVLDIDPNLAVQGGAAGITVNSFWNLVPNQQLNGNRFEITASTTSAGCTGECEVVSFTVVPSGNGPVNLVFDKTDTFAVDPNRDKIPVTFTDGVFQIGQETDSDGDGVPDTQDQCPNTPAGTQVDATGCPLAPTDSDGDGVPDSQDQCPNTPAGTQVDATGCPVAPSDSDGDGVPDTQDQCPNTPAGTQVDATGCPLAPADGDGDGVPDSQDQCPNTPAGTQVDATGCPVTPSDSDGDGVPDSQDQCPNTPAGTQVDANGCSGVPPDSDYDGDGVPAAQDLCPDTLPGTQVDADGCPFYDPIDPNSGWGGFKMLETGVAEEVLPSPKGAASGAVIDVTGPVYIRLRAESGVDASTVYAAAASDGDTREVAFAWLDWSTGDGGDGWIIVTPQSSYTPGETLTVTAGAMTSDGEEIGPVVEMFTVSAGQDSASGNADLALVEDSSIPPLPIILAPGASSVYRIEPAGVFAEPVKVCVPLQVEGTTESFAVYYFSESERHPGWYLGENVAGWRTPGTVQVIDENGQPYLEVEVNHSGVLQVGQVEKLNLGSIASVEVATDGSHGRWIAIFAMLGMFLLVFAGPKMKKTARK